MMRSLQLSRMPLPPPHDLTARRFRLWSQNEEDGIILALFEHAGVTDRRFVEIGSGRSGGNAALLAYECGWSGLMIDIVPEAIDSLRARFSHNPGVVGVAAAVSPANINQILSEHGFTGEVDLLSIDIDSYDYWVLESLTVVSPRVLVVEYNARFGADRAVTIPKDGALDDDPETRCAAHRWRRSRSSPAARAIAWSSAIRPAPTRSSCATTWRRRLRASSVAQAYRPAPTDGVWTRSRRPEIGRARPDVGRSSRCDAVKILFIARHYSYLRLFESAGRSAGRARPRRSCSRPIARRRWAGGRWSSASRRAIPNVRLDGGAGPARRRVVRAGAADPPRPRLPALPRLALRRRRRTCGAARAIARRGWWCASPSRAWALARRAGGTHSLLRSSSAASRARASSEQFIRAESARRAAHHAARGHRLAAARSLCRRAAARRPDGAAGRELGSPVEQGAAARASPIACIGLERDRSGRRPSTLHGVPADRVRRHRRAVLRPVVRSRAGRSRYAAFCEQRRPAARIAPFVLYVVLVALPGHGERAGVRRALDSGGAQQRRSAPEGHRHPGAAAPGAARRVAAASI